MDVLKKRILQEKRKIAWSRLCRNLRYIFCFDFLRFKRYTDKEMVYEAIRRTRERKKD